MRASMVCGILTWSTLGLGVVADAGSKPPWEHGYGLVKFDKHGLSSSAGFDRFAVVNVTVLDRTGQFGRYSAQLYVNPLEWPRTPLWFMGDEYFGEDPTVWLGSRSSLPLTCERECVAHYIAILQAKVPALSLCRLYLSISNYSTSSSFMSVPLRGRFSLEPNKINYLGRITVTITGAPGTLVDHHVSKGYTVDAGRAVQQTETTKTYEGGSAEVAFSNDDAAMEWDVGLLRQNDKRKVLSLEVVKSTPLIHPALDEK